MQDTQQMTKLQLIREQRGLTQHAVVMGTGIDQSRISKFETGKQLPGVRTLKKLAAFYGVSIEELITEDGEREPVEVRSGG